MIGQTLGHYRIEAKLGEGGMGAVYRAQDTLLKRTVAIKVPGERWQADAAARARLLEEARAASALNHPNICTIHEVGEAEGRTYIVMEYVEGRTLSKVARGQGLPIDDALRYGAQIADGLAHAHERGVEHRDLKSLNVMVTPEGRPKILDFGLAKRLSPGEAGDATRSQETIGAGGAIAGTLAYMAPEVLRGERGDARADLWALGVILHEMAGGNLPFSGQTGFELCSAILREPPQALPPQTPRGLSSVIERCLAKEPGQRYQRAGEVRAALEAIQGADRRGAAAAAATALRCRRWPWAAAAAGILLALAGLVMNILERRAASPPARGSAPAGPLRRIGKPTSTSSAPCSSCSPAGPAAGSPDAGEGVGARPAVRRGARLVRF